MISRLTILLDLIRALTPLVWPTLLAVLLWRLFPQINSIVKSRSFSVKIAGMEISVQDATEQIKSQIDDLQKQVILLRGNAAAPEPTQAKSVTEIGAAVAEPRGLWVDDKPTNNAFEIAQLVESGIEIVQAKSTSEAMQILNSSSAFRFIVSDMGRREEGGYRAQAGLVLLKAMKSAGYDVPFMVYSATKYAERNRTEVIAAGGDGATSSQVELLEWIRSKAPLTTLA